MPQDIAVSFARQAYDPSLRDYKSFTVKRGAFASIPKFLCREVWSPLVWRNGLRSKINFEEASLVGLDFDNGVWTLKTAINFFDDLGVPVIVGTTKSHQKEKDGKPPCDRYRVILLAERTTSLADYEYSMRQLMEHVPCDKSCKDGARYFAPCKEIAFVQLEGTPRYWLKALPPKPRTLQAYRPGEMPWWIRDWINNGVPHGERHVTCYKVGAELTRIGYPSEEIIQKIMRGPLASIGADDVMRAVENGVAAALGEARA